MSEVSLIKTSFKLNIQGQSFIFNNEKDFFKVKMNKNLKAQIFHKTIKRKEYKIMDFYKQPK